MIHHAWSLLDEYLLPAPALAPRPYTDWARLQRPRYLCTLGDACSASGDHGDAAEAFLQSVGLREENLKEAKGEVDDAHVKTLKIQLNRVKMGRLLADSLVGV